MKTICNLQPALDLRTKRATINCTSIPTMTVCHLTALLLLDVAHMTKMMTPKPNKLTALFARVLSWLSGLTNAPIIITAMTKSAPSGVRSFSGTKLAILGPVFLHTKRIGFEMTVIGTWKKNNRSEMASQKRNGLSHPVLVLRASLL